MIRKLFTFALTLPMLLAACSDGEGEKTDAGKGSISFRPGIDLKTETLSSRAEVPLSDFTNYKVTLEGNGSRTFDVSSGGMVEGIEPGVYTATLFNTDGFVPAFDDPRYSGSKTGVEVSAGATTTVEMTLTQANAGIYFLLGDGLEEAVPTVTQGADKLDFEGANATKTGYFNVGDAVVTLNLDGTALKLDGQEQKSITFQAGQLVEIFLSLEGATTGGLRINATITVVDGPNMFEEIVISQPEPVTPPKIGDYYYSDGTWSDGGLVSIEADGLNPVWATEKPSPVAGKTVVGIVFQTTPARIAQTDKDAGYGAYAMAVKNAHGTQKNTTFWSTDFDFSALNGAKLASTWYGNVNGYYETMRVQERYGANIGQMPAFDLTLNSFPLAAPTSSSGWFLPSTGQLWDMIANLCGHEVAQHMKTWQTRNTDATYYCSEKVSYDVIGRFHDTMSKIAPADKEELEILSPFWKTTSLWASTPYDSESACIINIGMLRDDGQAVIECMAEWYDGDCFARPILAF